MKKFMYVAIMAIMVVFAGCKSGVNNSDYYSGGRQVIVDVEAGKVNGVKYDTKTEKCWMWTLYERSGGTTVTYEYYVWGTEFELVYYCEMEMYEASRSGRVASYVYIEAPAKKTEEACDLANNE